MTSGGQWRVDPTGRYEYRWWDGDRFTEYVARHGEQLVDPAGIPDVPSGIEVALGAPGRQNRWTVAFRLILAIPHLVWITLLSIAAAFVVVIGWFAALFTARLPDWVARYLFLVLRYHIRLLSYVYLMRDDYPPFALTDERYPVTVHAHPGQLNRWAVLFRLILALPVLIVANWLTTGVGVCLFVVWLIVLVKGRMPRVLLQAVGAVLRFEARTYGYTVMLAAAYPTGLYGDVRGTPADEATGASDADEPDLPDEPRVVPLRLSVGAKRLLTLFLVLGIVANLANNVLNGTFDDADASSAQSCQVARSSSSSCSSTAPDLS